MWKRETVLACCSLPNIQSDLLYVMWAQAESVAQLVSARTPAAAGSALAGLQGGIGAIIGDLRFEAVELLAEFEVCRDPPSPPPPPPPPSPRGLQTWGVPAALGVSGKAIS